jgi:hypothetical protein
LNHHRLLRPPPSVEGATTPRKKTAPTKTKGARRKGRVEGGCRQVGLGRSENIEKREGKNDDVNLLGARSIGSHPSISFASARPLCRNDRIDHSSSLIQPCSFNFFDFAPAGEVEARNGR